MADSLDDNLDYEVPITEEVSEESILEDSNTTEKTGKKSKAAQSKKRRYIAFVGKYQVFLLQ